MLSEAASTSEIGVVFQMPEADGLHHTPLAISFPVINPIYRRKDEGEEAAEIAKLAEECSDWHSFHFGLQTVEGYAENLAPFAVLLARTYFPSEDISSPKMALYCKMMTFVVFMDDWFDFPAETTGTKVAQGYEEVVSFLADCYNENLDEREMMAVAMEKKTSVLANPMLSAILQSLQSLLPQIDELLLGREDRKIYLEVFVGTTRTLEWRNRCKKELGGIGEETFRNFRGETFGLRVCTELIMCIEHVSLTKLERTHPAFLIWINLVKKTIGCINDVLGFENDIAHDEMDSIIMHKIKKGKTPREAILEEVELIKGYTRDMLAIRPALISVGEMMERYVLYTEAAFYGFMICMNSCDRYSLRGRLTFS